MESSSRPPNSFSKSGSFKNSMDKGAVFRIRCQSVAITSANIENFFSHVGGAWAKREYPIWPNMCFTKRIIFMSGMSNYS